ncbi:MAG: hypothetical protein H0U92_01405 [Actinobacteria bacterium]|nr:hypothetical protein [Actinomycetota bacterium]
MKVTHGFVSFTEVAAGHHRSYNAWHLFDHLPEQYRLPGVVFGQRWVLTPPLRAHARATAPLDRTHYVTLYLMADPIEETLRDFRALALGLREKGRFHEHRTSHLFGPMAVRDCAASDQALVAAEAVPFRPNTGVHVRLSSEPSDLAEQPGAAGAWTFTGTELSPPELLGVTMTVAWLDGDPDALAPSLASTHDLFSATCASIDPFGTWDWFDS